jgi:hypothetical protein
MRILVFHQQIRGLTQELSPSHEKKPELVDPLSSLQALSFKPSFTRHLFRAVLAKD